MENDEPWARLLKARVEFFLVILVSTSTLLCGPVLKWNRLLFMLIQLVSLGMAPLYLFGKIVGVKIH